MSIVEWWRTGEILQHINLSVASESLDMEVTYAVLT